jgi:hypothetical protein
VASRVSAVEAWHDSRNTTDAAEPPSSVLAAATEQGCDALVQRVGKIPRLTDTSPRSTRAIPQIRREILNHPEILLNKIAIVVFFSPDASTTARAAVIEKGNADFLQAHTDATSMAKSTSAPPCIRELGIETAGFLVPLVRDLPRFPGGG